MLLHSHRLAQDKQELEGQLSQALKMYHEQKKNGVRMAALLQNPGLQDHDLDSMPPSMEASAPIAPPSQKQIHEYARYAVPS